MAENNIDVSGSFPKPDAPDSVKNTDEYGVAVAKAIYAANKDYIEARNRRFNIANLYYKGKQPVTPYLDLMNINGKRAFIDIKFKPRPIAKKFVKIIIGGYMPKKENPLVSSVNPAIQDRKQDVIDSAKWRILHKDFINSVQKESGMQLEANSKYTPSTVEEAELYYGMNNKQREEFLLEMMIKFVLKDNDYPIKKRRILKDLCVNNVTGIHDYFDQNGRIRFDVVPSDELIYGPSREEDFNDSAYKGRYKRMNVTSFRQLAGNKMTEEQIYGVAKSFQNKNGNGYLSNPFQASYVTSLRRPYDTFLIDVIWIWYKAEKNLKTSTGTDNNGRFVFDIGDNIDEKTNPNKKLDQKPISVGYEGWWVVNSDFIVGWGVSRNMIKRDDELEKVESPLTVFMIDNDGDMDSQSMVEDMISSIQEMDLDILKIQQIKAQQSPNGMLIDIDGLENINLGLGQGALKPLELREIRSQTGDVYYRRKNEPGDVNQGPPISDLKGDFGNMLQELIADYNFQLGTIRDYIGVNEYRDGSTVNPKTGLGVIKGQMEASNTATEHIYGALIHVVKILMKHIGQRVYDALRNPDVFAGYLQILGEQDSEFLSGADDITASLYDVDTEVDMSDEEKGNLEEEIQIALSKGLLDIKDIAAIRTMPNMRYAAQYLSFIASKNQANQQQIAAQNQQLNAQAANNAILLKAKSEENIADITTKSALAVVESKIQGEISKKKLDFYNTIREQAFILGKDVPPEIQKEIDLFNEQEAQTQAYGVQGMLQQKQEQDQMLQEQQQSQQPQDEDPNHIEPTNV